MMAGERWKEVASRFYINNIEKTVVLSMETRDMPKVERLKGGFFDMRKGHVQDIAGTSVAQFASGVASALLLVLFKLLPRLPPCVAERQSAPVPPSQTQDPVAEKAKAVVESKSAISLLQEWMQSRGEALQVRLDIKEAERCGLDHSPEFTQVIIDKPTQIKVTGKGKTAKQARSDAAALLYIELAKRFPEMLAHK